MKINSIKITAILTICVNLLVSQNIYTFAGTGTLGFSGDGGPATNAEFFLCTAVATETNGSVYVCDGNNHRVRKVSSNGVISTFAGNGNAGYLGDGGSATGAQLDGPSGITVDATGNVYIVDFNNSKIRKVTPSGIISTFAGTFPGGFSGDGGAATNAKFNQPRSIAVDPAGNIYVTDEGNYRVRKINTSGIISTFAGTGSQGNSGDGGAATSAQFTSPSAITADAAGNVYIADAPNHVVRKVNTSGTISNFAGNGSLGYSGDGGNATNAQLNAPNGLAVDAAGNVYITEKNNNRVRKVTPAGIISTFAGNGTASFGGDGGLATQASLDSPQGVAVNNSGSVYVVDFDNNRIRVVCTSTTSCITGIKKLQPDYQFISIIPNPNSGFFNLKINKDLKNGELLLINSIGQIVYSKKLLIGDENINIEGIDKGFYNCILMNEGAISFQAKMCVN